MNFIHSFPFLCNILLILTLNLCHYLFLPIVLVLLYSLPSVPLYPFFLFIFHGIVTIVYLIKLPYYFLPTILVSDLFFPLLFFSHFLINELFFFLKLFEHFRLFLFIIIVSVYLYFLFQFSILTIFLLCFF